MTDLEKREAIASLPGNIGYKCLLEVLNLIVQDAVVMTVQANTEAETLKAARNLQALFKYFNILQTVPQNILAEFEEEKKLLQETNEDPLFTPIRRKLLHDLEQQYVAETGQRKKGK